VILDQAYAEFDVPDFVADVSNHPRLIVTRTLSKAFGLAGLRIGYATGRADLMVEIEKSRGPYKVSVLAELAAVAALAEDGGWVRERIRDVVENRERFAAVLRGIGLEPLPSAANFVLVPVPDATAVGTRMRGNGVAVRPFVGLPRIGDALRITIGPWSMMEGCLGALAQALR
jgi:histidinol-phosphate aminotransferase